MHDLPYSPCDVSAPMASMHRHVNEWHGIKTKKQKINPNLNMLRTNKHVNKANRNL